MPTLNVVVSSLSMVFIILAIIISLVFPANPLTSDFAHALFWWFLALGIVRWIERRLIHILPIDKDDWPWYLISWISFGFFVWFLVKGAIYFVSALGKL